MSPDFLFYFKRSRNRSIGAKVGRGANFKEVSKKIVEDLQIPLPPLAEQKRIAGILDAADALRAKRREALAQLDTLLQSTFLDMFGDPVTNPMGWTVTNRRKLLPVAKRALRNGPVSEPIVELFVDEGIRVIGEDQRGCQ